jgi:Activator of Hsp90 ATPase homolog 1-like protein
MRGVYMEIVPPDRIVWTEPSTGMTTTSTFADLGGSRTEVRIYQANVPDYGLDPGNQARFLTSLDRFAA